jgi:CPA2 family monovalent cation:H+ antiporter-2
MLIDLRAVVPQLAQILAAVVLLVLCKAALLTALGRLFRLPLPVAANAGLHLAQGGEFAFVLFSLAMVAGVIPAETGQFLLAVVAVSMTLTPLLALAGRTAQARLEQWSVGGADALTAEAQSYSGHVVIAGFGRVGRTVAKMLDASGVKWIAVDVNAANVADAHAKGLQVFFGDAGQEAITTAARIENARAAVITLDDPAAAASALENIRKELPELPVIVRARTAAEMVDLLRAGATNVMPETVESSLSLGAAVLRSLGQPGPRIDEIAERLRKASFAEGNGPS